jgi:hypothetical protein
MNLPGNTPFNQRKDETLQALRILKILKANRVNSSDVSTLNSIILNLSGQELRSGINDIEAFTARHGRGAPNARTVNNAAITGYNFKQTKEGIKEVNRLVEMLDKLARNELLVAFEKNDYLNGQQGVDGLLQYKTAFEDKEAHIDDIITSEKHRLKQIIRRANRGLGGNKTRLTAELLQVRNTINGIVPGLGNKDAFKALGMKGYDDNISFYLDGVQKLIDTGHASGDISDSELGRLSRQSISIPYDVLAGGGIPSTIVFGSAALYGATLGSGIVATVLSGGVIAGAAVAGAVGMATMNYMRGGGLYQATEQ